MKLRATAAAILLLAVPARADFLSGNYLHQACDQLPDVALGYITGVSESVQISQRAGLVSPPLICVRANVTNGQIVAIACKFLRDNPSFRDGEAMGLVSLSLQQAFPCR